MGLRRLVLCMILSLLTTTTLARKPSNAVLLSDIKSLTFHAGKLTTARRVDPILQITCTGGPAANLYTPDTIRCTNAGSSYSTADIEWTCTASLPSEFKLGSTDVVCEGYDSADDDYILKGSCGIEYRLALTRVGEEKYGKSGKLGSGLGGKEGGSDASAYIFWAIFIGVCAWMAYNFFRNRAGGVAPGGRGMGWGGFGGGGGAGGDDNDDPPPPYDAYPPKAGPSRSTYSTPRAPRARPQQQQQGWRPGFWTGAAAGAAGGYFAGQRGQAASQPSMAQRPSSSSSFGDGGRAGPSYSGERYTSTGFGSTRRR